MHGRTSSPGSRGRNRLIRAAGYGAGVPALDHLVLATPDPAEMRARIAERTGVELGAGGPHLGRGTRNWLGRLGPSGYLELIGPDPDQPEPAEPRPFGVDDLAGPALVTWCARHDDLDGLRASAVTAGVELGAPFAMARDAPAGRLRWRLSMPAGDTHGGIVPFFIDWRDSPHPSTTSVDGLALVDFGGEHPDPSMVTPILDVLGVDLPVAVGPRPRLVATLHGPAGDLALE